MKRGVKQGCPLSALLFILVVEILALQIKNNNKIKGYKLKYKTHERLVKISQYADDATLFINDDDDIQECINTIEAFSDVAGPKLNINKSIGMHIGRYKGHERHIMGITFTNKPIKCLGVFVGGTIEECQNLNWSPKFTTIEDTLEKWKKRNLSLFGKVTVIKSFILSKITFIATNCTIPEEMIKKLNSILFGYIWGKRDRIKRNVLINDIEYGGIGMVDVESYLHSLKSRWLERIIGDELNHSNWSFFARHHLNALGENYLCAKFKHITMKSLPQLNLLPKFYQEVIIGNSKTLENAVPISHDDIMTEIIWGNKHIRYASKNNCHQCILFKSFIQDGIIYIGDLRFVNGNVEETYIRSLLKNKCDIFRELTLLRKCLKPFKHILRNHSPDPLNKQYGHEQLQIKHSYRSLINEKAEKPFSEEIIKRLLNNYDINFQKICVNKIKYITDKKLAEFNYKTLHLILPCNKNLKKWGKQNEDTCDVCGELEDIPHLLYYCEHASKIWKIVQTHLTEKITLESVLLGNNNMTFTTITSIVAFLIYKEWLLSKNENTCRVWTKSIFLYSNEINFRSKIYYQTKNSKNIGKLLSDISYSFKQ